VNAELLSLALKFRFIGVHICRRHELVEPATVMFVMYQVKVILLKKGYCALICRNLSHFKYVHVCVSEYAYV